MYLFNLSSKKPWGFLKTRLYFLLISVELINDVSLLELILFKKVINRDKLYFETVEYFPCSDTHTHIQWKNNIIAIQ